MGDDGGRLRWQPQWQQFRSIAWQRNASTTECRYRCRPMSFYVMNTVQTHTLIAIIDVKLFVTYDVA